MGAQLGHRTKSAIATCGIGLLATVGVTACGAAPAGSGESGTGAGERPTSTGTASGRGGAVTTPAGRGGSGGTAGGDATGREGDVPRCRTDQLSVELGRTKPAAGNRYAPLVFTNDSGRTCALSGYPGVTVLNGDKEQIGPDAERAPGNPVRPVTVEPNESASSLLHWASKVAGDCHATSTYLRTFPPGSTGAIIIPAEIRLCGDIFYVRAVTEGTDGVAG